MILMLESLDTVDIPTRLALRGWVVVASSVGSIMSFSGGRTGTNGLRFQTSGVINFGVSLSRQVVPTDENPTFTVGFSLYLNFLSGITHLLQLMSDELTTEHVSLYVGPGGQLHVAAGPGLPVVLSSSVLLDPNAWNYIELQGQLSSSAGSVSLQVNGANVGFQGSINTINGGTKIVFDSIRFSNGADNTDYVIDDIYLTNGVLPNSSFLGDTRVEVMLPDGNGTNSGWTNDLGNSTNNFSHVDSPTYQLTTFVHASVSGTEDTYDFAPLPFSAGTIAGIQTVALVNKTNSAFLEIETIARVGGVDYAGAAVPLAMANYQYLMQRWDHNPATSAAWTIAAVNGSEYGVKVV